MVNVLVLGGHGRIALQITKLLAASNHTVTSVIRDASQIPDIKATAPSSNPSLVKPLVSSLEETPHETILEQLDGIDWVVWSAGAGGKGGAERTIAVDQEAAKKYITASISAPSVSKFLTVSASVARRDPAPYWDENDISTFNSGWSAIPVYCEAKLQADGFLYDESRKLESSGGKKVGWEDIHLRPGTLNDNPATGKVDLGRARARGGVTREDVADVAVRLLLKGGAKGLWLDLVNGEELVEEAVERVVSGGVTSRI